VGRYFGREPRLSRQELELDAQQAIDARVSMGRPPVEDWAPIEARLAEMDRERAPLVAPPAVPPARPQSLPPADVAQEMSLTEVRLPVSVKAGSPPRRGGDATRIRIARRPVGAQER